jgi:hypothetical protein
MLLEGLILAAGSLVAHADDVRIQKVLFSVPARTVR